MEAEVFDPGPIEQIFHSPTAFSSNWIPSGVLAESQSRAHLHLDSQRDCGKNPIRYVAVVCCATES
jgi:hypothetical protein